MLLAGRWWKLAYKQIHGNSRTKAQSAKACKKWFLRFLLNKNLWDLWDLCDIKFCVKQKKMNLPSVLPLKGELERVFK